MGGGGRNGIENARGWGGSSNHLKCKLSKYRDVFEVMWGGGVADWR